VIEETGSRLEPTPLIHGQALKVKDSSGL